MADCLEGDCLKLKRKRLEKAKSNPAYVAFIDIFERLTGVTEKVLELIRAQLIPIPLSPYMAEKFAEGLPLADRKNLPVSAEDVDRLLVFYVKGLSGINNKTDAELSIIKTAITTGEISGQHLIDHFVMGQEPFLSYVFERGELNNHLLFFIFRNLFKVCLTPFQETLPEETELLWDKGVCPVCGFSPDMGVLLGKEGKLHLHCALCGHVWPFRKMACPFCNNDLQKELNYLEVEGDTRHKIHLCQLCLRYLKVLDVRNLEEDRPLFLDLEDLISLHLDIIADQKGYLPGISLQTLNEKE